MSKPIKPFPPHVMAKARKDLAAEKMDPEAADFLRHHTILLPKEAIPRMEAQRAAERPKV